MKLFSAMQNKPLHGISLLLRVFRASWWVEPVAAYNYLPLLSSLMQEGASSSLLEIGEAAGPQVSFIGADGQAFASADEAVAGSTGVLYIDGVLDKADYACWPGTATMARTLKALDKHPNIGSLVLHIDSPGGSVDGTKDIADVIRGIQKPLVAWVDGMAASAGYWLASSAKEVVLSNDTSMVGSIGTMFSMRDMRPAMEREGVKFHDVFADESFDKNKTMLELLKGNYGPIKEEMLNPLNALFMQAVQQNRKGVQEEALHGKMYIGQHAIDMGLADSIGTLEMAIARAQELSALSNESIAQRPAQGANSNNNSMFNRNKFPLLTALIVAAAYTPEALEAVNQELDANGIKGLTLMQDSDMEAAQGQYDQAVSDLKAAITELETTKTQLSQAIAERDGAQALAEEYGAKPGASHSEPVKPEGDQIPNEVNANQQVIDELPHNKAVDNNPIFQRVN